MRNSLLVAAFFIALPAISQELQHLSVATANGNRPVTMSALRIVRQQSYPSIVRLTGTVEIRTPVCLPVGPNGAQVCDGEMILRADEASLNESTGEIEAHGNVRVTPLQHGQKVQ